MEQGEFGDQKPWGRRRPRERVKLRRHLASAARKKPSVSLSLFLEVNNLEVEHELACAATCFGQQTVWTGPWSDDVREAWRRQVWEATLWTKVRGPAGALLCEMRDLGITVPSLKVLRVSDNSMVSKKDTCTGDIKKTLMRHAKDACWRKWA